jgi:hypothetical protein
VDIQSEGPSLTKFVYFEKGYEKKGYIKNYLNIFNSRKQKWRNRVHYSWLAEICPSPEPYVEHGREQIE